MTSLITLPYADLHAHDRASAGWCFNAAGALVETAANLPRVDYDPATLQVRGLLVEEAATNRLLNARQEGAAAGSPGTVPSGSGFISATATYNLTRSMTVGVESGLPYVEYRWVGTANATNDLLFNLQSPDAAAASGQAWTLAVHCVLAGAALPTSATLRLSEANASVFSATDVSIPLGAAPLRQARRTVTRTFTDGSTNGARPVILVRVTNGVAYDFTIRMAAPQLVQAALATSDVFPLAGAPGPSTRAADRITRTLNHRFSRSAFTLLTRGLFAQPAPAGMTRGVLQLDDGTDANRIRIENTPGGSALQLVVTAGGADTATLPLGNMTPGTPFGVALAFADGDLAAVRGGGAVQTAAVAVPPGLAFMRVGATGANHANPMNGWIRAHRLMRGRIDNASLISMAA